MNRQAARPEASPARAPLLIPRPSCGEGRKSHTEAGNQRGHTFTSMSHRSRCDHQSSGKIQKIVYVLPSSTCHFAHLQFRLENDKTIVFYFISHYPVLCFLFLHSFSSGPNSLFCIAAIPFVASTSFLEWVRQNSDCKCSCRGSDYDTFSVDI